MIKEAIVKIVNKGDLSYDEAYAVMNEIMSGETTEEMLAKSETVPDLKFGRLADMIPLL